MTDPGRELYAAELERHVLALREALVRHDENLKADDLMQSVPYLVWDRPAIATAREEQRQMVLHIRDPEAYEHYYGTNPHERPFEEQYGIRPEDAHEALYRIRFLREALERLRLAPPEALTPQELRIIDLSANDGFMAVNLGQLAYTVDCVDLHPGNCAIARQRKADGAVGIREVLQADLHQAPDLIASGYDVVVCFETVEHVVDPDRTLEAMGRLAKPDGRIYVSTPFEAVEQGNLPAWDLVEPKGHVRAFRAKDFEQLLERHGEIKRLEIGPDRVMVAEVTPAR